MSAKRSSRLEILDRVRLATPAAAAYGDTYANLPRPYIRKGKLAPRACVDLLIQRLREYEAEVVECAASDISTAIRSKLAASGRRVLLAPPGLPEQWRVSGFDWRIDHELSYDDIENAEGVVTAGFCAIADSGTIVLHHSPSEGRRIISLLPDWHLCILRSGQVVETLPEYFARCKEAPKLATYISGPSATADIEMTRIKGVHGPRSLHVILIDEQQ